MGKIIFIIAGLMIALLLADLSASQGMGGSKAYDQSGYDWMGTPVSSGDQVSTIVPDDLNAYNAGRPEWDPFRAGQNAFSLQLLPADPVSEGLVVAGGEKLANQLYLQSGKELLTQGYVTPGWYRINGAYANYLGAHIYRFFSTGLASNNLSIMVGSGSYPTSFRQRSSFHLEVRGFSFFNSSLNHLPLLQNRK